MKRSSKWRFIRGAGAACVMGGISLLLVLGIELSLSRWVYSKKDFLEPAFCSPQFNFIEDCNYPSPFFHLLIAKLALLNAVEKTPKFRPQDFREMKSTDLERLDQWRNRLNRHDPLPWDKTSFVDYTYDRFGRRIGDGPNGAKSEFLAFFGCSWTHGDWLPPDQALPGQVKKIAPDLRIYNYGIPGGGLQELFLGSHSPSFLQGIPEKKGVYVYVYNWMHLFRLKPSLAYVPGRFNAPTADYVQGDRLGYGGTFYQAYPVLTPALISLGQSGIGRATRLNQRLLPEWEVEKIFCDMLVQTRDHLESLDRDAKFVVLLYTWEHQHKSWRFPLRCLEENKIPYFAPFFKGNLVETHLPDRHPDGETHRKVAAQFMDWLKRLPAGSNLP